MDHFRYIKIHTWLQTKEMYHSFLSLKMISFDFDDFFQASQPSTVKPRLTATSVIRPLFWPPGKNRDKFSSPKKKTLVNTVTSLKRPNFFGPLVTVSTAFHCMNISIYIYISALVYRDEKKRRTVLQMFTLTQKHGEDCHFYARRQPAIISGKVTTGALTSSTDQSK